MVPHLSLVPKQEFPCTGRDESGVTQGHTESEGKKNIRIGREQPQKLVASKPYVLEDSVRNLDGVLWGCIFPAPPCLGPQLG